MSHETSPHASDANPSPNPEPAADAEPVPSVEIPSQPSQTRTGEASAQSGFAMHVSRADVALLTLRQSYLAQDVLAKLYALGVPRVRYSDFEPLIRSGDAVRKTNGYAAITPGGHLRGTIRTAELAQLLGIPQRHAIDRRTSQGRPNVNLPRLRDVW